jgi:hypothetical protein
MPWSTAYPVLVWAVVVLALAAIFWFFYPRNRVMLLLWGLDFLAANLVCFFIINWAIVNYYLRFIALLIPVVLIIRGLIRLGRKSKWLPSLTSMRAWTSFIVSLVVLVGLVLVNVRVLFSFQYEKEQPVPLLVLVPVYGMWVVTNGGSPDGIGMSNYANPLFPPDNPSDPSMAYGVDLQEITIRGSLSQQGSRPSDFRDYEGFNKEVFAPCPGPVVKVDNSHPIKETWESGEGLGNLVVVHCFETYVTIADLTNILVKEGDNVRVGQTLGYVGNSAEPSIPHIHMHATVNSYGPDGIPVPLLLEYVFPTRNTIFIR